MILFGAELTMLYWKTQDGILQIYPIMMSYFGVRTRGAPSFMNFVIPPLTNLKNFVTSHS